jgi:inorganic pyrophosphatase
MSTTTRISEHRDYRDDDRDDQENKEKENKEEKKKTSDSSSRCRLFFVVLLLLLFVCGGLFFFPFALLPPTTQEQTTTNPSASSSSLIFLPGFVVVARDEKRKNLHLIDNNKSNITKNMTSSTMTRLTMSAMHSIARRASLHKTSSSSSAIPSSRRHLRATTTMMSAYQSSKVGDYPSMEFRCFYEKDGKRISPWHDVPLKNADGSFNFICEIPKETKAKMEVATDEKLTPIKQDTKKGKLRDYPYNINWNYGMLPQTWEDPQHVHPTMNVKGDNDPVDVVEIGSTKLEMGSVTPVKPLGVYAMIDEGELDWKVICISTSDPKASDINDVADVEKHMPGELEKIRVWFRDYKTPDGKPQNMFGLDDQCMPSAYAKDVIEETHEFYMALKSGKRANDEELSLE